MSVTEVPTLRTYRICVEPHLPPDWLAARGVHDWTSGRDAEERPTTSFLFEAAGQAGLLELLDALPGADLLLSVEWVRAAIPNGAEH